MPAVPRDRAATRTVFDPADLEHRLAARFERFGHLLGLVGATITTMPIPQLNVRAISSGAIWPPCCSSEKIARQIPRIRIDHRMAALGQNPRNILEKSAAGDMRQALDLARSNERQERADINPRRLQQGVAKRPRSNGAGARPRSQPALGRRSDGPARNRCCEHRSSRDRE